MGSATGHRHSCARRVSSTPKTLWSAARIWCSAARAPPRLLPDGRPSSPGSPRDVGGDVAAPGRLNGEGHVVDGFGHSPGLHHRGVVGHVQLQARQVAHQVSGGVVALGDGPAPAPGPAVCVVAVVAVQRAGDRFVGEGLPLLAAAGGRWWTERTWRPPPPARCRARSSPHRR